jgi:hypothetical protein
MKRWKILQVIGVLVLLVGVVLRASAGESSWTYVTGGDEMTGKPESRAWLESADGLELGFPYQGHNPGEILVRSHPRYGLGVIFSIRKGQLVCNAFEGCSVLARFDNSPPVRFRASPPADHSSTALFLEPASKFISLAKKAHDIRIQATVYENGAPVLTFHSSQPLRWPVAH